MKKALLAAFAALMLSGCILISVDEEYESTDYDPYIYTPPPSSEPLEARTR